MTETYNLLFSRKKETVDLLKSLPPAIKKTESVFEKANIPTTDLTKLPFDAKTDFINLTFKIWTQYVPLKSKCYLCNKSSHTTSQTKNDIKHALD